MSDAPPGMEAALDVFVGYIMLDAWIANQDRHHENWGALRSDKLRLAPTFDHGALLGATCRIRNARSALETRDRNRTVAYFAQRARSAFYSAGDTAQPLGTVEVFLAILPAWLRRRPRPGLNAWRKLTARRSGEF